MESKLRVSRREDRRLGQSMLEFALVVPFFLVILFSLFEFGRAMVEYTSLSNAAREGARTGIVSTKTVMKLPECELNAQYEPWAMYQKI